MARTKKIKIIYFLLVFLTNLPISFASAVYVLFLLSKKLDLLQVNLICLVFVSISLVFEVPTGAFADYFGRRKSVIVSNLLITIALLAYFLSSSLAMFIIAEIGITIGLTFSSGAIDAWLIDSLGDEANVKTKLFSKSVIVSQSSWIVGGLVGAWAGDVDLSFPFALGAIISLVTLIAAVFLMKEKKFINQRAGFLSGIVKIADNTKQSIRFATKHSIIFWLISASIVASFAFMSLNIFWTPRLNILAGGKIWLMGWVLTGMSLAMMMGSYLIFRFAKIQIVQCIPLVLALPLLFFARSNSFLVVLLVLLVHQLGRGMFMPTQQSLLNEYIPNDKRATILSFNSMISRIGTILGLLIFGFIGKYHSIELSWIISGFVLMILLPIYIIVRAKQQESNEVLKNSQESFSTIISYDPI